MKKRKKIQLFVLLLSTFIFLSNYAFADDQNLDAYVIIEGENLGTVLLTEKDSTVVNPTLNPIPNATGMIGAPEPIDEEEGTGCDGDHYHGTLFNEGDPNSRSCGWGRVIKIKNPTDININLASFTIKAINRLSLLRSSLQSDFEDFSRNSEPEEGANLSISLDEMNDFLQEKISLIEERLDSISDARDNKEISSVTAKKLTSSLGCAQRTAKDVIRRIKKFKEKISGGGTLDSSEDKKAIDRMFKRIDTIRRCLEAAKETSLE